MVTQPDIPAGPAGEESRDQTASPPPAGPPLPGSPTTPFTPVAGPRQDANGRPSYAARYQEPFIAQNPSAQDHDQGFVSLPGYPAMAVSGAPYGQPLPPFEPPEPPAPRRRLARSPRFWLTVVAALLGVAGLLASAGGLAAQIMPRRFSPAQRQEIMAWQTASHWRTWPAGKIFPAQVSYQLSNTEFDATNGLTLSAHRVGIAPQTSCRNGTDRALAGVLDQRGCEALMRATYTDATGSLVLTVGVAVMRGAAPPPASLPDRSSLRPTVKTVPFRRTLAAGFGDRQRQVAGAYSRGPYLVLYTAGFTDGRRYDQITLNPYAASEFDSLGSGVAQHIGSALGAPPPVPRCPGAPGC
ncbi:MAG TPA: hypothetical protein VHY58_19830 [Streptosporangiaceae bacterium]|nr:hypothetical protein [Streptosporangiaceae bacterium]